MAGICIDQLPPTSVLVLYSTAAGE